ATNRFLTFTLAEEQYAVDVIQVREVLSEITLTVIPRIPSYLKGVINIRGSVVPVVDLRTKLGLPDTGSTLDTSIIVMDLRTENGDDTVTAGCLADSVQEVVDIPEEDIEPPPRLGTPVHAQFMRGLAKKHDRFIILLDINRVFETGDLSTVQESAVAEQAKAGA
ncbi:MAG: chemotaxis protein CheW, partial [Spirochaetia bacterium]